MSFNDLHQYLVEAFPLVDKTLKRERSKRAQIRRDVGGMDG